MATLSVLVPAYQEADTIGALLDGILALDLRQHGWSMEVVVCDDGSTDDTSARVRARRDERVRLVRHGRNLGKGAAVRTALAAARGDWVLIQDADLEYDPSDYGALLAAAASGARAVYGSRFLRRRYPARMALPNFVCNRLLTGLANVLYGSRLTDQATCYKLIDAQLLRALDLQCDRFDFCPEVTAKLGLCGIPITEVPVAYTARSSHDGKKIGWRDGVRAFQVLLALRLAPAARPALPSAARS